MEKLRFDGTRIKYSAEQVQDKYLPKKQKKKKKKLLDIVTSRWAKVVLENWHTRKGFSWALKTTSKTIIFFICNLGS